MADCLHKASQVTASSVVVVAQAAKTLLMCDSTSSNRFTSLVCVYVQFTSYSEIMERNDVQKLIDLKSDRVAFEPCSLG